MIILINFCEIVWGIGIFFITYVETGLRPVSYYNMKSVIELVRKRRFNKLMATNNTSPNFTHHL